ncbi:LOW QUALITY PROTEIN: hypothetical protein HID58_077410 [Brassica napus]|uniref:ABC transmembrane type-1 domain-containing protein n=1 Tax=Brassica napus TaxID=3708 RepID=A0ABQ7YT12_BRANA|nr:LOW QUALITY PROTEIN: hypothetical protein HID58_077410 [Brassica napus]
MSFLCFGHSLLICESWFHQSIKWLLRLSKIPELTKVPSFSKEAEAYLQAIIDGFNVEAALEVKKIEKVTNHDVKAVEYFLKQKCESHPEFAKDINNLSHRLMLRESLSSVILPSMDELIKGGFLDVTVERQAARIRSMYLKTILRQDIGFFNVETNTGEVVGRMSGDTVLIQDAMGEKVGKFIQLVSTFVGGFALAFVKGWLRSSSRIIYYVQKQQGSQRKMIPMMPLTTFHPLRYKQLIDIATGTNNLPVKFDMKDKHYPRCSWTNKNVTISEGNNGGQNWSTTKQVKNGLLAQFRDLHSMTIMKYKVVIITSINPRVFKGKLILATTPATRF